MSVDAIIGSWREVRAGLIDEASQIPADKFSFRAAEGMRTVAELLQHLVESQKFLVGEACRPDTNLLRKSFAENIKDYAPNVREVNDKDGVLQLLATAMDDTDKELQTQLADPAAKDGLKLLWFSTGSQDFLLQQGLKRLRRKR